MNPFARILVPVDFSDISLKALQRAKEFALHCGSDEIHLLFAFETNYAGLFAASEICLPQDFTNTKENLKEAEGKMENLRIALQQETGLIVMGSVWEGNLSPVCKNYVKEKSIDLIIMAPPGSEGIREFIFGNSLQDIITTVNCPVLSLRLLENHYPIKKIILPVENFYPAQKLFLAIQLTKYFIAEIHLISLIEKSDWLDKITLSILFSITEKLDNEQIQYKLITSEKKNITEVFLEYAENESPDLILINPVRDSVRTENYIGTTSGSVIYHTQVPVLSV